MLPALSVALAGHFAAPQGQAWVIGSRTLACGVGLLARNAAHRVGPDGAVMVVDPDPGMLTVARRLGLEVDWRLVLEREAGYDAADALRAPFVLVAPEALVESSRDVGMPAEVEPVVGKASFPSMESMVEADLGGWLPAMGVNLDEELIEQILREAEDDLRGFVGQDGRMDFDAPAHNVFR